MRGEPAFISNAPSWRHWRRRTVGTTAELRFVWRLWWPRSGRASTRIKVLQCAVRLGFDLTPELYSGTNLSTDQGRMALLETVYRQIEILTEMVYFDLKIPFEGGLNDDDDERNYTGYPGYYFPGLLTLGDESPGSGDDGGGRWGYP
ncbi:hypothetical protein BGX33_008580 [Mortierella sp. NVP41]|nr:hypothetical protein BGX33_008580 [Mortierella sp. NVP41]